MKKKPSTESTIVRSLVLKVLIVAIGALALISILWINGEYQSYRTETASLRERLLVSSKEIIKNEVDKAVSYIEYRKTQILKQTERSIKERVLEAHAIAFNMYKEHRQNVALTEIKKMVKDALRPIRFNNGRGYYFAFNLEGIETLFADRPEMEGKNMLPLQNIDGQFVVKDMLEIAKANGQGFYNYRWTKPNADGYFQKIAFIKLFEPFGWVFGAGEYPEDIKHDIQAEVADYIEQIRYKNDGYIFIGKWDGLTLSGPGKGKNNIDVIDVHGLKIVKELIHLSKSGSGFLEYVMPKMDGKRHAPKLAYVTGIPEWEWYVGTGVYIDEIENIIAIKSIEFRDKIIQHVAKILLACAALVLLVSLLAMGAVKKTNQSIQMITRFFKESAVQSTSIDPDRIDFAEFKTLALSANEMTKARNLAEEGLRKSEERLKLAMDSVSDAVWDWRVDTGEVYFSSRWYTMLGYEPYELPQEFETWRNLLHPEDLPGSEATVFRHLESAKPFEIEFRMRTKDNQWRWILARGKAAERNDQGKAVRMLGTHMDITERKKMEAIIQEAQKMESIGSLAGGIAHDFNNILFPIVGMSELLLEDLPNGTPEFENAEEILKAGKRGSDLVKQILAFSRQSEHKMIPTRIQNILKEVIKLSRSTIPTYINIEQDIQQDCGFVMADPSQIHQIGMNIITNAYHALEDTGGKITVVLKQSVLETPESIDINLSPGTYAVLSIADTGHGMSKEIIHKIFDPYFTTKEQGKGTGLGLAVVYGIVKEHSGDILVESQIGAGTTFNIYLPLLEKSEEVKPIEETRLLPTGTEHILLVDDEEPVAKLEKRMLERLGYQVTSRINSVEALEAFRSQPDFFDLVITDMTMPNLTGDQLVPKLRAARPDIPIIICTGFSERIDQDKAKALRINGLLMKPIVKADMAQMVREVLDEAKGSEK